MYNPLCPIGLNLINPARHLTRPNPLPKKKKKPPPPPPQHVLLYLRHFFQIKVEIVIKQTHKK